MWRAEKIVDAIYRASCWSKIPSDIKRYIVDQQEYGILFEYLNLPRNVSKTNILSR